MNSIFWEFGSHPVWNCARFKHYFFEPSTRFDESSLMMQLISIPLISVKLLFCKKLGENRHYCGCMPKCAPAIIRHSIISIMRFRFRNRSSNWSTLFYYYLKII